MGRPYTSDEIERLRQYNAQGLSPRQIVNLMTTHSYPSIRNKLSALGLKAHFPETRPLMQMPPVDGESKINDRQESMISLLKKRKHTIIELADSFNVGPRTIKEDIVYLQNNGYVVNAKDDTVTLKPEEIPIHKINVDKFFGGKPEKVYLLRDGKKVEIEGFNFKFGAIADTHIGSKYERLDVLNALYDIFEREGVKVVLHGGNYIDGEFRFNKHETITHGFDEMIDYFLKNYPRRKGIKTFFISGDDHEGWWTQDKGIDPGKVIEERQKRYGRDDLVYLGYQEANLELRSSRGSALLKILHGGKGTSYADSYRTQKMVEALQEGEKPHIMLVGHYHKSLYHTPRGVHSILLGCTQDQTRFMRKNEIKAYVGGWLIEINQAPTGEINRFKPEWIQFWDKKFYEEKITHREGKQLVELLKDDK